MTTQDGKRAALWDVDGTLIDSREYHWLSWQGALADEGFPITTEQFADSFGRRNDEILRGFFPSYSPEEITRVGEAKEVAYRRLVREQGIELLPGVRRWLDKLHEEGWRQAVASSAPRANLEVIVVAAAKLGVEPSSCVVVEDAPAGAEAARRAGMRCVGVLSSHGELEADIVVRTLEDLPETAFDDLLRAEARP